MREITNTEDIIDSRDVIERIEELEAAFADGLATSRVGLTWEEAQELVALREFAKQGEGFEDWVHGATLIRETYFEEYAKDSTLEIEYDTVPNLPDYIVIDWKATSDNLLVDYSEIEFGDVTYYIR